MTEKAWWEKKIRPVLHRPDLGRCCKKVQDAFQKGRPDLDYCDRGVVTLIELKYFDCWPVRGGPLHWAADERAKWQRAWMREWEAAKGSAVFLLGVGKEYYVLDTEAPQSLTKQEMNCLAKECGTVDDLRGLLSWLSRESS